MTTTRINLEEKGRIRWRRAAFLGTIGALLAGFGLGQALADCPDPCPEVTLDVAATCEAAGYIRENECPAGEVGELEPAEHPCSPRGVPIVVLCPPCPGDEDDGQGNGVEISSADDAWRLRYEWDLIVKGTLGRYDLDRQTLNAVGLEVGAIYNGVKGRVRPVASLGFQEAVDGIFGPRSPELGSVDLVTRFELGVVIGLGDAN